MPASTLISTPAQETHHETDQAAHARQVIDKIKAARKHRLDEVQPPPPAAPAPKHLSLAGLREAAKRRRVGVAP